MMDEDKNFYDEFSDLIDQLIDDQSLFQAEPPETCEELVIAGKSMVESLVEFKALGKFFWMSLPETDLAEIIYAIKEYKSILLPPKICCGLGAYFSCLVKLSRSGIEYEKRLFSTHAIVIDAGYSLKLIVIGNFLEKMNSESMQYLDYVNRMNGISNSLANLSTKGGDHLRENARIELLAMLDQIDRFIKHYFEEDGPQHAFRMEACRRITQTGELLSSRSSGGGGGGGVANQPVNNRPPAQQQQQRPPNGQTAIHRRILVKAQANMQEIMNSVAGIASDKASDYADNGGTELNSFARINGDLLLAKTNCTKSLTELEVRMVALQLDETLFRIKEQCDSKYAEANYKIKEAVKRWKTVKTQSGYRNVVVYEEEEESKPMISAVNGVDPMKALNKTGKQVGDGLKKAVNIPGNAAKGGAIAVMGGITGAVGVVTGGVKGAATGIASGVKGAATGIASGVKGAVDGLKETFNDSDNTKKKEEEPKKKGFFDSVLSDGSSDTSPPTASKFNYSALGTSFGVSAANLFG